jgi:hypothetical protein
MALVSALGASTVVGSTSAQTLELPRPRQGYYMGGGLAFAVSRVTDEDEMLGYWPGSVITARAGQMFTDQFGLGLGLNFGGTGKGAQSASFGGLGLQGQWEWLENLTLRGGVGFAVVGLQDQDDPDEERRGSFGGDYSLGLAYDWFFSKDELSGGWTLTPVLEVRYLPDDPVSTVLGVIGLEILYFNGLPSNELELPAGEGYDEE